LKLFELTDLKRNYQGHTLTRIRAVVSFHDVKAGDLGGWIEDKRSIGDHCWVYPNALVFKDAQISGGTIRGGRFFGGDVYGGHFTGGTLLAGTVYGGFIAGGTISGGEMQHGHLHGGELAGGTLYGGTVLGGRITGGEVHGGKVFGDEVRSGTMLGGELRGGVLDGGVLRGGVVREGIIQKSNYIGFANLTNDDRYLFANIVDGQIMVSFGPFFDTLEEFYADNASAQTGLIQSLRTAIVAKLSPYVEEPSGDCNH